MTFSLTTFRSNLKKANMKIYAFLNNFSIYYTYIYYVLCIKYALIVDIFDLLWSPTRTSHADFYAD